MGINRVGECEQPCVDREVADWGWEEVLGDVLVFVFDLQQTAAA